MGTLIQWFSNYGPGSSTRPPEHFQWATESFKQILLICYTVSIMHLVLKNVIFAKQLLFSNKSHCLLTMSFRCCVGDISSKWMSTGIVKEIVCARIYSMW